MIKLKFTNMGSKNSFNFLIAVIIYLLAGRLSLAIDINTASAEELARELVYVGPVKAQRIVEYRQKIGKFVAPEQLLAVYGIGPKTLERNWEKIVITNNMAQTALLNKDYHIPIDLSPSLAKSPRLVTTTLFEDTIIIIPLLGLSIIIFIATWLIGINNQI